MLSSSRTFNKCFGAAEYKLKELKTEFGASRALCVPPE